MAPIASGADRPHFWEHRRVGDMLSHKVFCGCCGGAMANICRDYLACSAARRQAMCSNRQGSRRGALENLILDALVPAPRSVIASRA
jgi:site-specific DNA recombinase